MENLSVKIEKFSIYIMIVYMSTMTGLYFHMDSRINALQTMQDRTFEKYSLKEQRTEEDILAVKLQVSELSKDVKKVENNILEHLTNLSNIIVANNSNNKEQPKK